MKCDNCIHSDVCANKNKVVQINEYTWEEFAKIDDVENHCTDFKNKHDFEQVVHCIDCCNGFRMNHKVVHCIRHGKSMEADNYCKYSKKEKSEGV